MEIRGAVEAILFVAETPITTRELAEVVEAPLADVELTLGEFERELTDRHGGFVLRQVAGGWRLYTAPEMLPYVERFAASERATRLSNAALETLAVVAYKQPVSRGQIADVRGVDSERALHTLERRGLVREIGPPRDPGRRSSMVRPSCSSRSWGSTVPRICRRSPTTCHRPRSSKHSSGPSDRRDHRTTSETDRPVRFRLPPPR